MMKFVALNEHNASYYMGPFLHRCFVSARRHSLLALSGNLKRMINKDTDAQLLGGDRNVQIVEELWPRQ